MIVFSSACLSALSVCCTAGVGIISSGVRNESDPALALLTDYLESPTASANVRTASAMGLGAYTFTMFIHERMLLNKRGRPTNCNSFHS